ncbi:MAG: glutathione S-transferase family protein [Jaaginema sp. PMC 1079.18]|nr:glutathione S-transferase family protein [Jaaginema sp. PMC 1080.18]MEC4850846.1 glutathione S-transferase family protein [Jaaginema sp. PMC 1079.18]MEC4867276.1 glutathione S-transferase family protein [Jaaginema sp. PMC 1078.18]
MLKLYGGQRTRAAIVQWYLEEKQIPYEFVLLDLQAGEHRQPEYLAINPMGKLPAIVDGDFKLWESGAILLYLAEKHGEIGTSIAERSMINQWIVFANATLGPGLFIAESRDREMPKLLPPLNQILDQQPFLLGKEISVVDIAVGSLLVYTQLMLQLDLSAYPAVTDYIKRLMARDSFKNSIGKRSR